MKDKKSLFQTILDGRADPTEFENAIKGVHTGLKTITDAFMDLVLGDSVSSPITCVGGSCETSYAPEKDVECKCKCEAFKKIETKFKIDSDPAAKFNAIANRAFASEPETVCTDRCTTQCRPECGLELNPPEADPAEIIAARKVNDALDDITRKKAELQRGDQEATSTEENETYLLEKIVDINTGMTELISIGNTKLAQSAALATAGKGTM